MVYNCFDKKSAATRANISATYTGKGSNAENQQLTEELHKPIIRKFEKSKVYSSITDNV